MNAKDNIALWKKIKCVGCGWCCHVGVCYPGTYYHLKQQGFEVRFKNPFIKRLQAPCPYLEWSEEDQRYWCSIIDELTDEDKIGGLHLNQGCNHPYNEWRTKIVLETMNKDKRK